MMESTEKRPREDAEEEQQQQPEQEEGEKKRKVYQTVHVPTLRRFIALVGRWSLTEGMQVLGSGGLQVWYFLSLSPQR